VAPELATQTLIKVFDLSLSGYQLYVVRRLGHPREKSILGLLRVGPVARMTWPPFVEVTVMELAASSLTQPAIWRHLKVLKGAGLSAPGPWRQTVPVDWLLIAAIDRWLGLPRQSLAKNYDRLDRTKPVGRKEAGDG
jgi:hypothetical protein